MKKPNNKKSKAVASVVTLVVFIGAQVLSPVPIAFATQPSSEMAIPARPEVPISQVNFGPTEHPDPSLGIQNERSSGEGPLQPIGRDFPLRDVRPLLPHEDPILPEERAILERGTGRVIRFNGAEWANVDPDPIVILDDDGNDPDPRLSGLERIFHFTTAGLGVAVLTFASHLPREIEELRETKELRCLTPDLPAQIGRVFVRVVEGIGPDVVHEVTVRPGDQILTVTQGSALDVFIPTLPEGWVLTDASEMPVSEPEILHRMRFGPGEVVITRQMEPMISETGIVQGERLTASIQAGGEVLENWEIQSWDPPTPRRRSLNVVTTDGAKISFSPGGMYRMDQTLDSEVYGSLKKTTVVQLRRTRTGFRLLTRARLLYASVPIILRSGRILPRQQLVQYESFKYDRSGSLELTRAFRRTADGTNVVYQIDYRNGDAPPEILRVTVTRRNRETRHYDFLPGMWDMGREESSGLLRRISGTIFTDEDPREGDPIRITPVGVHTSGTVEVRIMMHHHETTVTETEVPPLPVPEPGPEPRPDPPVGIHRASLGWSSASILLASGENDPRNRRNRRIR